VNGIAVLGLGRMGAAITARLANSGHQLVVWNRSPAGYAAVRELAGQTSLIDYARTPADAVGDAQIVLTMLADATALKSVLFGPGGAAPATKRGAVICDMSTIGVDAALECAQNLSRRGIDFVDAPVSGSVASARSGQLLIMPAGASEAIDKLMPVFESFASKIIAVGPSGSGQSMKLAVNSVLHALNTALSEGLVLAERAGIDRRLAYEVFAASAVSAPYVQYKRGGFERPESERVSMSIDLMLKDLELIHELAQATGSRMPVSDVVRDVAGDARSAGLGQRDMSAVAVHLRTVGDRPKSLPSEGNIS
jgi:3-hydroxyisobutyrate dehydrogenase-like beta-hydroxyacid dehydrogenase